jgi:hypothetical protein
MIAKMINAVTANFGSVERKRIVGVIRPTPALPGGEAGSMRNRRDGVDGSRLAALRAAFGMTSG